MNLDLQKLKSKLPDTEKAQEALSAALLATVERWGTFNDEAHAYRYCLKTARMRLYRGDGRKPRIGSLVEECADQANTLRGYSKTGCQDGRVKLAACVRAIRNNLGSSVALPWILCKYEGVSTKDAAQRLGMHLRALQRKVKQGDDFLRGIGYQGITA